MSHALGSGDTILGGPTFGMSIPFKKELNSADRSVLLFDMVMVKGQEAKP
jgi:hypothetical protein